MKRALLFLVVACVAAAVPARASAQPAPVTWCGTDEVAQNRVPDLEVSAAQQIRVVYAIPSDGVDNFFAAASGIATDIAWIEQWWEAQDPTRTPRFDRYPFPGCTSTYGALDLGFLRLPNPTAYYLGRSTPSLRLDRDLRGVFPPTQKTIVYYDAPISDANVCGETDYLSTETGGDQGIVYIYPQSCDIGALGTGGTAEVAAHELLHNLGAAPDGAPHECPDSPNHVCDSPADILYPYIGDGSTLDSVTLDVGRDDYYADGVTTRWDVQRSNWLSHLPQFPFSAGVQGSGTLVALAGGGKELPCTSGCSSLAIDNGTNVSITAVPARGWAFSAWSGSCSGITVTCTVGVAAATDATATFVKLHLRITAAVVGRGTVHSIPAGISCPGRCAATFATTSVRLVAKAARGWKLTGWTGRCRGRKATCTVTAAGPARARFVRK